MKKSKQLKLDKELRPWIKYYDNIPSNLEYFDGKMVDLIIESAQKYPDNIAYSYYGMKVTYKELIEKIEEVAKSLKLQGITEDDIITICMPNTPEAIIMFYAVNMIGGICNMVHPLSSEKELEHYINLVDSKYILVIDAMFDKVYKIKDNTNLKKIIVAKASEAMSLLHTEFYWIFKGRKIKIPKDDESVIMWQDFVLNSFSYKEKITCNKTSNDPAAILYSGGTTGTPKGILLSNKNFNALANQATTVIKEAVPSSSVLALLPIFHGFGLGVCIHTPLSVGMGLILIPTFDHKKFGNLIKKNKPNFIVGVPTLYEALINTNLKSTDLESVTSVICGGDILSSSLCNKVNDYLYEHGSTAKIRVGYGLTESTGATCLTPTNIFNDNSIGVPFPDTYFKIVSFGTQTTAPIGVDGEICISGPTVMMGYINNEVETMQTLRIHDDGKLWLHTGDIGHLGKDSMIYFSQRLKRIIVSSGYNIYPSYIESVINSHEKVLTSIVIGIPHSYKGQVAKAFIILKNGYTPNEKLKKEIKDLCYKNISKYSLPYEYEFRDKLPKTLIGKIAYRELEKEEQEKLVK